MRDFLDRHRPTLVSLVAAALPLFLLYVHGRVDRRTTVIEYGLMRVVAPVQATASRMLGGLERAWGGYVALVDLNADNDQLRKDVRDLTGKALRAKELGLENRRLRGLLAFKRSRPELQTVGAHVIGVDISAYARVVRVAIDAGEEDGIAEGMPVITTEGLVGRVRQVAGRYAEVMLTVDARSSVNVKVAGKGVTGNLEGSGSQDSYRGRLLFLHKARPLELGDTLVTSGHDRLFPPNIEVGYIHSLEERQQGLYYEVEVAPAVNFSVLQEVHVVIGSGGGGEAILRGGDGVEAVGEESR